MKTDTSVQEVILCDCGSSDHQVLFLYDTEDKYDDASVYVHIHLADRGFWNRLRYGVKYIFGYKSRFGAFDEVIFEPNDVTKLQKVVDYLNKNIKV